MPPAGGNWLRLDESPFLDLGSAPFTALEAVKLVLLLPLVVPRVLVGVLVLCLIALINGAAAYNWPVDKPLTPARRRVVLVSKELLAIVFW